MIKLSEILTADEIAALVTIEAKIASARTVDQIQEDHMSDMSPELEAEAGAELVEEGVAEEVEPEVKDEAITGYIDFRVTINPDTGSVTEVKLATDQIHLWSHDLLVQTVPAKDVIDAVKAKLAE